MAFWQYNGTVSEVYPALGLTARPGQVYDFGSSTPPAEAYPMQGTTLANVSLWTQVTAPATDVEIVPGMMASDLPSVSPGEWTPQQYGLMSWSYDPAVSASTMGLSAGVFTFAQLLLPKAALVTNVCTYVSTAGATLTAGRNFAAIYQNGNLLGQTVDQSTPWISTGFKTMALGTPVTAEAGPLFVGLLFNGTTAPLFLRGASSGSVNLGLSSPRFATGGSGITTTAPGTIPSLTVGSNALWVALN